MEVIKFEKEVVSYLGLPSLPTRKWDGKSSFKRGIAVVELMSGDKGYAVSTFDAESDTKPRITKVFTAEQFFDEYEEETILVVPEYMNTEGVDTWDIPEESKKAAESLIQEGNDLIGDNGEMQVVLPDNEYSYDFIRSDEEAIAFFKSRKKGKRGSVPTTHEAIVAKLAAMYATEQNKKK